VRLELEPPNGVTVFVNEVPSSYLDLADPGFLAFEYFQQMDVIVGAIHPAPAPLKVLHLGAAGCSLARAWDATRPDSRQVAVDIDAALVGYMREWFGLPTAPDLRLRAQSAENAVATAKPGSYDVIVRDVFSGDTTPLGLTSAEFGKQVSATLKPNGIYLANCADKGKLALARKELTTLQSVFTVVAAVGEVGVLSGKRFGNVVLAASKSEVNVFDNPQLDRNLRALPTPAKLVFAL